MNDVSEDLLKGVFSIQKKVRIGAGTTARRVEQTAHFYAEERPDGMVDLQGLNANHVPFGPKTTIEKELLLSDYLPDPGYYQSKVLPKLREMQKALARGEKYRRRGETFTAEFEYSKALQLDEQNVRANFGIGICYIQRGEDAKAREVFDRVVAIDAAFEDEHKHLFNEFGIELRKKKMFDEAVEYYQRALEFDTEDENLHYNAARACLEKQDFTQARTHLGNCLKLDPEHQEGLKMLEYMDRKGLG